MALKVAIVGGGIGGATAANALLRRGLDVTIYERTPAFREIGAGVSLGPNASRLLIRLGLEPSLSKVGVKAQRVVYADWRGDVLSDNPTPPEFASFMFNRAELLSVLAEALPPSIVRFGSECVAVSEDAGGVRLSFADGTVATADVAIGADGINSVVRKAVVDAPEPAGSGMMAYRALVPVERLDWVGEDAVIQSWLGPNRHILFYPVSSRRLINVVGFVPTDNPSASESWTAPGDPAELLAMFAGWEAPVVQTIRAMDTAFRQGLYDRDPLARWCTSRIALLGDAAHPMLPHMGQGAGQAIEDGFALAQLLADASTATVGERLQAYQVLRMDRTTRVQALSRRNGELFRRGDDRAERDREVEVHSTDDFAWLYRYDAELEAQRATTAAG